MQLDNAKTNGQHIQNHFYKLLTDYLKDRATELNLKNNILNSYSNHN